MEEIWVEIENKKDYRYNNQKFFLSNYGRAKICEYTHNYIHYPERIINQHKGNNGYYRLSIGGVRDFAHRWVAKYFIPNPNNKPEVNHIDGDKSNNRSDNLEWVDRLENCRHASLNGLINKTSEKRKEQVKINRIKADEVNRKPVSQYTKCHVLLNTYISVIEASRQTGICASNIANNATGRRKSAGGYIWEYQNKIK